MDAKEKLLFKVRYDEIGHEDMELEACYELLDTKAKWGKVNKC